MYLRNLIDGNYCDKELLGFINEHTKILEFQNSTGSSQFYFKDKYLINSFSTNKENNLSTGTIKLIRDFKKPKSCSKSSSKPKLACKNKSSSKSKSNC